jgi:uncharacterized protein (TIGR04540 family)
MGYGARAVYLDPDLQLAILRNPTAVKLLANEIKAACNAYISKKISEKEVKELIFHCSIHHGDKLFDYYGSFKPTIRDRLGSKRCGLLEHMLRGVQIPMF